MIDLALASIWQGAVIVALAALLTRPVRAASTRYAIWYAALFALALLPLVEHMFAFAPMPTVSIAAIGTVASTAHAVSNAAAPLDAIIPVLWGIGVGACAVRLALSYRRIARIVGRSTVAPPLGADVLVSGEIEMPIAVGLVRPVVIVPAALLEEFDARQLAAVLAHERAHIRRGDLLANFVQRVVGALLFFNPFAFLIGRALVNEREAACDDWAVCTTREAEPYARALASLAQRRMGAVSLLTPSVLGSRSTLVGRIARLLNGKAGNVKTNHLVVAAAIGAFALLGFVFDTPRGVAALDPKCFSDARPITPVAPEIPDSILKSLHTPAQTSVLVTVGADGRASSAKLVESSGNATIDRATVQAAEKSTYKPAMSNCHVMSNGKYLFHTMVEGPK